jgi:DNA-binding response OmpR family regulator
VTDRDRRVLVVEDEESIASFVAMYLEKGGFQVSTVATGEEAIERERAETPALIVLDLGLPDLDGMDVCRRIRQRSDVPILMLTARDDDVDKIVGLEVGADDYLTKPFNPRELVARVKAILRRSERAPKPASAPIHLADLTIDPARREVTVAGRPVTLRTKEFDLLQTLAENRGIVLSREQLLNLVWGFDFYGQTRTVDVHIAHLRKALAGGRVSIETITGVGYKLTAG